MATLTNLAQHYNYVVTIFLMMAGLYIVIARGNMVKKLIGLSIFQTSVYLLYIEPGKIIGGTAPIIDPAFAVYSNPLPHVLILTAIVVGVATLALGLALVVLSLGALVAAFPAHSLVLVLVAAVVGGVGHGMAFLGAQTDVNAIAPPDRRGEVTAAFFVCVYLGVAVSAIGVGLVATSVSLYTAVAVFACVTGAACVGAIAWHVVVARGSGVPLERS